MGIDQVPARLRVTLTIELGDQITVKVTERVEDHQLRNHRTRHAIVAAAIRAVAEDAQSQHPYGEAKGCGYRDCMPDQVTAA